MDLKEQKKNRDVEIRNILLPLATGKPNMYKKMFIVIISVFYLMLVLSYLTNAYFVQYPWIEAGIIIIFMVFISKIYDWIYVKTITNLIEETASCAVIGFSNKLLVLSGEDVLTEYDTDEIKIRPILSDEEEGLFRKSTSIIECFKNGDVVGRIAVNKLKDYEGLTLKADMSRANEDLEIVYDDDDYEDETDFRFDDPDIEE